MSIGKILVCDDDRNICELLRLYLEKEGYTVTIANDGEEALSKFAAEPPDLILLDINLPNA
ncbi:MAG: response regulator, partial [Oscillospiraceae bacterium]|nr:response regulator [Oscillospiraceae bacterium]